MIYDPSRLIILAVALLAALVAFVYFGLAVRGRDKESRLLVRRPRTGGSKPERQHR